VLGGRKKTEAARFCVRPLATCWLAKMNQPVASFACGRWRRPAAQLYLKVGTLQASHASATSDGTNAAKYPNIRRFIVVSPSQIWRLSIGDRDDLLSGEF